ncbi:MAG TPA: hypothetical protein VJZ49_15475 [Syntrophales bacterium]|nr:hypothetical protein [Syntrophales bacterium]
MNIETIKQFCFCGKDETWPPLMKPWQRDGYIYASDGEVMIRVPAGGVNDPVEDEPKAPSGAFVFDATPIPPTFYPIPDIEPPAEQPREKEACERCSGEGFGECPTCGQVAPCGECEGTGKVTPKRNVKRITIGGRDFAAAKLYRIKTLLPGAHIGPNEPRRGATSLPAARITFDGGEGLIMPMKAQKG